MSPVIDITDKLKHQADLVYSGAASRAPLANIMDASDVAVKLGPEKHLRWVNIKDVNKVALRKTMGYERVSEADGGRVLGDEMALFVVPTAMHERAVKEQKEENVRRLSSHKTEMQQVAENTARILRDKYGVNVKAERLFTDEGE